MPSGWPDRMLVGCGPHCALKDKRVDHCPACHQESDLKMADRPQHGRVRGG